MGGTSRTARVPGTVRTPSRGVGRPSSLDCVLADLAEGSVWLSLPFEATSELWHRVERTEQLAAARGVFLDQEQSLTLGSCWNAGLWHRRHDAGGAPRS